MKLSYKKLLLAIFTIFLFIVPQVQAQPDFQEVQQDIVDQLAEGNILGVSIAYIYPDGRTQYISRGSLSDAREESVDKNTIFEIGSVSKTFTTLIMMKMAEDGVFSLDTPIENILPDSIRVPSYDDKKITLKHLATHTSGLPRLPNNMVPSDPANPYADYDTQELYRFLNSYSLTEAPGTSFAYSNLGVGLLGHLLTLASGKSYAQLLQEYITIPLHMSDTDITVSDQKRQRFASPYNFGLAVKHWDFKAITGAGAIRSTANDMAIYLKAQMGLQVSDLESAIDKTHQVRFDTGQGNTDDIGLAWFYATSQDTIIWHNGGTGGFRSFAGFNKERGTGVVILSSGTQEVTPLGLHLLDDKNPLPEVKKTVEVDEATLDQYVVTYQLTPAFSITVTREGNQLITQATGQQKIPVYPESPTKFFLRVVDAQIEFIPNDDGAFTKIKLYQNGRVLEGKRVGEN